MRRSSCGEQRLVVRSAPTGLRPRRKSRGRARPIASRAAAGRGQPAPPAGGQQPQGEDGTARQRAEASHVPAHRVRDREGRDRGDRVDGDAQRIARSSARQEPKRRQGEQRHPDEGGEREWLLAAGRKGQRKRGDRGERRKRDMAPPRRSPARATAAPASAKNRPATGLAHEVSTASAAASGGRFLCRASNAPRPIATPRAKVRRPENSIAAMPAPNHRVARRARSPCP